MRAPHRQVKLGTLDDEPALAARIQREELSDEAALVARVRAGDPSAFETIFRAYYATTCEIIGTMVRSRDVAAEVVSEAYLGLWRRRTSWNPRGPLLPYLIGAARHQALTHIARRKHDAALEQRATRYYEVAGVPPGMGGTAGPGAASDESERWEALQMAVRDLPPGRRAVLLLRWERQLTFRDIAAALGISVRTAESQYLRAMRALREKLVPPTST